MSGTDRATVGAGPSTHSVTRQVMKHPVLARFVTSAALLVLWSAAANADVIGPGRNSWGTWVSPTTGSGAFWENVSRDGRDCDVALWSSGTGNCTSPIAGFYRDGFDRNGTADDWYGISLNMPRTGLGRDAAGSDGLGSTTRKSGKGDGSDESFGADGLQGGFYALAEDGLPVPEPATLFLLGGGLFGVAAAVRRRRRP
jgi:hypothetical protein